MTNRLYTLLFALLLVGSIAVSRLILKGQPIDSSDAANRGATASTDAMRQASLVSQTQAAADEPLGPRRSWEVLDPALGAEAIMVQSLDAPYPFLNYHTYTSWPMASLTKLVTALVVLEDIGKGKKIPISIAAVATKGNGGGLEPEEVYSAEDLVKIMLLASSNDAAAAFEEFGGGTEAFVRLMTKKIESIGMTQTIVHDASGLSELNVSTASDLIKLARYIAENEPDLFAWARLPSFIAQPINSVQSHVVSNINPFVADRDFLGGKTGTSDDARQNLLAVFSHQNYRLIFIVLGSSDRVSEVKAIRAWLDRAYEF